ncbi:MAG TPA: glycoside hydrolase family 1 protein, partial [Erysipelothrix sp.]|nr:glycoside hydrolase family 1 protein [Erysipelothrix sp.]
MLQFPKNFWWGAATSAPQTEGAADIDGKSPSTWDKWFELEPERFDANIGPETTSTVYENYKNDVALMKETKLNSFRTSIAWTRLLPDGQTINQKAVAYYRDYFTSMKEAGVTPIINLFHFDMPWWQMEKGGWLDKDITDHFAFYAKTAVELFGDIVEHWVTFNEPIVHVEMSYIQPYHYPAEANFKHAILAGYHTILAHAKAIKAMREVNPKLNYGTILNLTPVYGRSDAKEDEKARRTADLLIIRSFLDGMVKGTFDPELIEILKTHDLMPTYTKEDLEIIADTKLDFLGVNYYQPNRVKAPLNPKGKAKMPDDLFAHYEWPDRV